MATASIAVRLNAITGEFEQAFSKATRTVSGFEKTFQNSASSVEAHQKRLNAAFAEFSGDRILRDANEMASAISKIGGASRLTEAEQKRVNATVTEAIEKYKALGQSAPASLVKLLDATKQVVTATEKIEAPVSGASKAMGLLGGAFGQFTAANLAANAITSVTTKLGEFVAQGAKLPGLQSSFERLNSSIKQDSAEMLASLQDNTRGLVSNIDLMQSANKAILLGLPVTTKEMGELAKTATVLGKAMGQDATKSLDDLITALGRSSPLILDNLGLSVKVGEANEVYAAKLGKTVEQLTDAEKKTAFYNAAMEAARAKTVALGEQTLTLGELSSSAWVQIGNAVSGVVAEFNEGIGAQVSALQRFIDMRDKAAAKEKEADDAKRASSETESEWRRGIDLSVSRLVLAWIPGMDAYRQSMKLTAEATREAASAQQIFNAIAAKAPKAEQVFNPAQSSRPNQFGTGLLDVDKYLDEQAEAMKEAERRAKAYGEALERLNEKIKPLTDAQRKQVGVWLEQGKAVSDMAMVLGVNQIAVERQKKSQEELAKILDKGIGSVFGLSDGFKNLIQQLRLTDGIVSTLMVSMPKFIDGLGTNLPGVKLPKFELPDPPPASAWERYFLGLSDASAEAARVNGDVWALSFDRIAGHLGSLGAKFDNLFGDILSGAARVADALAVIFDPRSSTVDKLFAGLDLAIELGKKAVNLFKDEAHEATNDIRDDFLLTFGPSGTGIGSGFANLAKQLHEELGPAGDVLFDRLLNAKKVEDFNRVVAEIEPALAKAFAARPENQAAAAGFKTIAQLKDEATAATKLYEYVRDSGLYSAEAVQQAWERANAALVASGDETAIAAKKATDFINGLKTELQSLEQSVANEAPEEVMGNIEREQRARIDAIKAEVAAREEQISKEIASREDAAQKSVDDLQRILDGTEFVARLRFEYELPEGVTVGGGIPALASGGIVRRPTLALVGEAGPEAVVPLDQYRGGSVSPEAGSTTVQMITDGVTWAEIVVPHIPGVVRRYIPA